MQKFYRGLKVFEADTRGSATILSAVALTILPAFALLGAECGAGLLRQSENQRIADSAGFQAPLIAPITASVRPARRWLPQRRSRETSVR